MTMTRPLQRRATARDLHYFRHPELWPARPFLPVVRRFAGGNDPDLGVMYDAVGHADLYGFSATVFLSNVFNMPVATDELMQLARCVYDTVDELAADGWTVD